MSIVAREPPLKTLPKRIEQIQEGKLTAWTFITRLDTLTQRESDGEPIITPGIEVLAQGMTADDMKYIASKLRWAREVEDTEMKYDLGLL